jgi:hypothetical protein
MVIHGLLLCKLRNLQNYSDRARMLVDSYLNGRTQFVRCGEKESSVGRLMCGVPQRSVTGPLLFVSYNNDVLRVIISSDGFIFMQMISRFITVLVFRIYKGVMMRSTFICSRNMSGQRLID